MPKPVRFVRAGPGLSQSCSWERSCSLAANADKREHARHRGSGNVAVAFNSRDGRTHAPGVPTRPCALTGISDVSTILERRICRFAQDQSSLRIDDPELPRVVRARRVSPGLLALDELEPADIEPSRRQAPRKDADEDRHGRAGPERAARVRGQCSVTRGQPEDECQNGEQQGSDRRSRAEVRCPRGGGPNDVAHEHPFQRSRALDTSLQHQLPRGHHSPTSSKWENREHTAAGVQRSNNARPIIAKMTEKLEAMMIVAAMRTLRPRVELPRKVLRRRNNLSAPMIPNTDDD